MKKFSIAVATLALSALLVFSGCFSGKSNLFNYLKSTKEFEYEQRGAGYYKVNFTVNRNSTYSLSIINRYGGTEPDIQCEGKLEYFGDYENHFTTEWMGVTQNNVDYYYAIKLTDATAVTNGESDLYLMASNNTKIATSFSTWLILYKTDNPEVDATTYVKHMSDCDADYIIRPKS